MHLHHVNISATMPSLLQEKQFFVDVLGLHEGFRPVFSNNRFWLYQGTQPIVHLTENHADATGTDTSDNSQTSFDHVAFQSTGLANFTEQLNQLGKQYTTKYIPEINSTQVFLHSPTGAKIEVLFPSERT